MQSELCSHVFVGTFILEEVLAMRRNEEIDLPIFTIRTDVHYYCPDGVVTEDLEEAKEHGYGKDGRTATSFGHDDGFATFDYSVLPEIENLSLVLERCYGVFLLDCYSGEERFMRNEVWYTSRVMENGR